MMLGHPHHAYHLEFTHHRGVLVGCAPRMLVFYLPEVAGWQRRCERMLASGFERVQAYNPYWDIHGQTFEGLDGYRVVLQARAWTV